MFCDKRGKVGEQVKRNLAFALFGFFGDEEEAGGFLDDGPPSPLLARALIFIYFGRTDNVG